MHDAYDNAFSVGIQSDKGSTVSKGAPRFIWERVQNGKFSYGYLGAATHNVTRSGSGSTRTTSGRSSPTATRSRPSG
ncbi:hypothetical protein P9139_10100 [Curtobacterium flaccumfaciens]|nr:hypothetical protein P9139_10100 [Curtobacterium flaccumfaciens]